MQGDPAAAIIERTVEVDGIETFVRERGGDGAPVVFVHGNPTSSADWVPFLERIEGPALAFDLPGFGRSARPDPARFDHSLAAYADFTERLLDQLVGGPYGLVVHDWGGLALVAAQRHPARLRRLVVIDAVPLNDSYRWHWVARLWRTPRIGEAFNAINTKSATRQLLRLARPGRRRMPEPMVEGIWSHWDAGMSRAILGLYRSADPAVLAAAGKRLGELDCRALVIWASEDPYLGVEQGRWYAAALPNAELELVADAGHWPWLDRPETIDRVLAHLAPPL